MNEELKAALEKMVKDNRLTCTDAQALARELGMRPSEVGKAADELGIKIKNCQLGCF